MLRAERGNRLVDRLLRRLGLVRLAHVERIANIAEISPEMIKAGSSTYYELDERYHGSDEIVPLIYLAMERVRRF